MVSVYISPEVRAVRALHPYLDDPSFRALAIRDQIARQADTLGAAHAAGDERITMQVMSWWPDAAGKPVEEILAAPFTEAAARLTVAREYGFPDWAAVAALGDLALDAAFETALDLMLAGEIEGLQDRLGQDPSLTAQRSRFGHRSTLLHYLGANGVESHRQVTPMNAVALAELLIARGADRSAAADMYGGGQTAHALAVSSAHPLNAGLREVLGEVLKPD